MLNPANLPVYQQKERILEMLKLHQVIVIESPTGSGKTTQLPLILHEAGYSENGVIGVTQPRRIAALSVTEYINKQLNSTIKAEKGEQNSTGRLAAYKIRFEDNTDISTKIKIMTDGILLQEMKLDPYLSKYSVIMVDEAHERSLNIDFILGLLKRVLQERKDFKVIVSSATINTALFSIYFDDCPVVKIDAVSFPVSIIYDEPERNIKLRENLKSKEFKAANFRNIKQNAQEWEEALLFKINSIMERISSSKETGDVLIFLPGEKLIKNCIDMLSTASFSKKIHLVPLYGRLGKEEQEKVFDQPPFGRRKVVVATNIAETSITIDGITTVIDSGLAKLNYYNPKTYTSSLLEMPVSKASCNQRRGRAGRTREGICYRLYTREDFESRPLYTTEEIYRTDLSEVVLRMAELEITDFESFDFISPPNKEGLKGAVKTLNLLEALTPENRLSKIGEMMAQFPLLPRQSRMIVAAILEYHQVIEEVITAAAFLSAQSPFLFPDGQEMEARNAHRVFRGPEGDFYGFIILLKKYTEARTGRQDTAKFCKKYFLDERVMAEILNIKEQLEMIVSEMGIPITGGGSQEDFLYCIARGMLQFVCVRDGKNDYRTMTAEKIQIHPGSGMFRETPDFIVAGEIVKTSKMYAMSVSPLSKKTMEKLAPSLLHGGHSFEPKGKKTLTGKTKEFQSVNSVKIGSQAFSIEKIKGRKILKIPYEKLPVLAEELEKNEISGNLPPNFKDKLTGEIIWKGYTLCSGEKLAHIFHVIPFIGKISLDKKILPKANYIFPKDKDDIFKSLDLLLWVFPMKTKKKQLGFAGLFNDGQENFWFKISRDFNTVLYESLASISLINDKWSESLTVKEKTKIGEIFSRLNSYYSG